MKIGDLVKRIWKFSENYNHIGIIIGFNKKGEGGKDFAHVYTNGTIEVVMSLELAILEDL